MAMANMVVDYFKSVSSEGSNLADVCLNRSACICCIFLNVIHLVRFSDQKFFRVDTEIIPFFEENWESLTPLPRRIKTTWHATIGKTLAKETELFVIDERDENLFALKERDFLTIGPMHKDVKNVNESIYICPSFNFSLVDVFR